MKYSRPAPRDDERGDQEAVHHRRRAGFLHFGEARVESHGGEAP